MVLTNFDGNFQILTLKVCLPRVLTDFDGNFASLTLTVCLPRVLTNFDGNFASLTSTNLFANFQCSTLLKKIGKLLLLLLFKTI